MVLKKKIKNIIYILILYLTYILNLSCDKCFSLCCNCCFKCCPCCFNCCPKENKDDDQENKINNTGLSTNKCKITKIAKITKNDIIKKYNESTKEVIKEEEDDDEISQEQYLQSVLNDINNIKSFNKEIFDKDNFNNTQKYVLVKEGTEMEDGRLDVEKTNYGFLYKVKNKEGDIYALKEVNVDQSETSLIDNEIQNLIRCKNFKNVIKIVDCYKYLHNIFEFNQKTQKKEAIHSYYIITDYYEKGDLYNYISNNSKNGNVIEKEEKEKYIYEIINVIKTIHDSGIYHGDVKPANIFLDKSNNIFLGDFGYSNTNNDFENIDTFVCTTLYTCDLALKTKKRMFIDMYSLFVTIVEIYNDCKHFRTQKENFCPVFTWEYLLDKKNIPEDAVELFNKMFVERNDIMVWYEINPDFNINMIIESDYYKRLENKYK